MELPQATVVHQLLQQGHSEVSINGIVAQNGTTTLQVNPHFVLEEIDDFDGYSHFLDQQSCSHR